MSRPDKSDKIVWYLMTSFFAIILLGGGAWATSINNKVDKIAGLESNVGYIQKDISEIKQAIKDFIKDESIKNFHP